VSRAPSLLEDLLPEDVDDLDDLRADECRLDGILHTTFLMKMSEHEHPTVELSDSLERQPNREVDEDVVQCRICLVELPATTELLSIIHEAGLIAPCSCAGTSRWIHRSCLDELRTVHINGRGYNQCLSCYAEYQYEEYHWEQGVRCWLWFVLRMTLDVLILFVVWNLFVGIIELFTITFDTDQVLLTSVQLDRIDVWSAEGIFVYYLWSTLFGFAIVGLITTVCLFTRGDAHHWGGGGGRWDISGGCLLVLIVVLAVLGLIAGLFISCMWLGQQCRKHVQKVWHLSEVRTLKVRDLSLE